MYFEDGSGRGCAAGRRASHTQGRRLLLAGLLLLGGCNALKLGPGVLSGEAVWPTEGETPQRRHAVEQPVALPMEAAWTYNAGAGFGPGSPLIWGDVVVVANRKGEVHAISLETGKRVGEENFGDAVEGTPLLQDGTLFVPVAWGGRILQAYDLVRGRTNWSLKGVPIEAGLLYLSETLVAMDVQGTVWAYDPATGAVRWQTRLNERVAGKAAPVAVAAQRFVVADDQGNVSALRVRDGVVAWTRALRTPVYATPAASETMVYVPTTRGRFFALDAASGRVRWRYAMPDSTIRFTAPALAGGDVVFGGSDGILRLLDARTGDVRWTFDASEALGAAPLLTENVVFMGSLGRKLYALDRRTGMVEWETELGGRVKSAMAVRDDGLVVLTEPQQVYFFKPVSTDYAATD